MPTNVPSKRSWSVAEMQRGIERIKQRIDDLNRFDVGQIVSEKNPPELTGLGSSIDQTLARIFGEGTYDYERYKDAARLNAVFRTSTNHYPSTRHYVEVISTNINKSRQLLQSAIRALEDDIAEKSLKDNDTTDLEEPGRPSPEIFIVHGHAGEPREAIARFLERLGLRPIILHEQANQGKTIIEKFETYANVGFAIVLLTPDDVGGTTGGAQRARARQNVILELGYFIGRLKRERVCALKVGDVELPSDILGIVWTPYDAGGAWKLSLGQELQAAGYDIDWNRIMN
ncbi:nucleotide-binding protein [Bradyrhizobium sp. 81013]|nr:nucleotide-binding protein [Bradyrhizobium aeschynomenes]